MDQKVWSRTRRTGITDQMNRTEKYCANSMGSNFEPKSMGPKSMDQRLDRKVRTEKYGSEFGPKSMDQKVWT